jgi:hypothetical protein
MTGSIQLDAERAFVRATRERRRAALGRRLRRQPSSCGRLAVFDGTGTSGGLASVRPIPIERIEGTLEPSRARMFDGDFRPAPAARARWQRVWQAEQQGAVLPPVELVQVGDGFAVRDGHHRVSVARARGADAIDATVSAR